MEYGMLPKIDQFSDNKALEVQKVQPSSKSSEVTAKDNLEEIKQSAIDKQKEVSQTEDIKNNTSTASSKYETVLTNLNFGFNDASKDFYVKAIRGKSENQYPTQDMMRIKAYLLSQDTAS